MAEASKTIEMEVSKDKLWNVIWDFENYPKFVDGCSKVKVVSGDKNRKRVQFDIQLLGKDITYVLDHTRNADGEVSWTMVESNIFKSNEGSWTLRDLGDGKTEVTYRLALEFKIYVPGMVLNGLVKSSLPKMMGQFEKQAKGA